MSSIHIDIHNVSNPEALIDSYYITKFLNEVCRIANLKVIQRFGREFTIDKGPLAGSKAYTFVVVLGTSSLVYHTYPESRGASFDLTTCVDVRDRKLDLLAIISKFVKTENGGIDLSWTSLARSRFLIRQE